MRERLPGGVLGGIFVDDRRGPKERATIISDHGTVLKNGSGSFLVLEDGNLERFEAGKRDPALVAFGRYAFDMSKFSNQGRDVTLGIRERYLWELLSPSPDDPVYQQMPGQFRAELHDRFMAPMYPFAFAALTFAFLGAPRTTRQSRNFSIGSSILAVFGLRMAGFACSVMATKSPLHAIIQYLTLAASPITVAETSLFRVPQLLEKMMPFCILIGAMTCYLALSRRLELVVARAAGVSAWQFIAPALASAILLGVLATTAYNPISANLRELSKRMEAELFGSAPGGSVKGESGFR